MSALEITLAQRLPSASKYGVFARDGAKSLSLPPVRGHYVNSDTASGSAETELLAQHYSVHTR